MYNNIGKVERQKIRYMWTWKTKWESKWKVQ